MQPCAAMLLYGAKALTPITSNYMHDDDGPSTTSLASKASKHANSVPFAVQMWKDDQARATATYGHIKDWDVSSIVDMYGLFKGYASFNEDISGWGVSGLIRVIYCTTALFGFRRLKKCAFTYIFPTRT